MNNYSPDYAWNLLPWRVEQRQQQQQRYLRLLCKTLLAALLTFIAMHLFLFALLFKQNERNSILLISTQKTQANVLLASQLKQQIAALHVQLKFLQELTTTHQTNKVYGES